jgi:hypothetical protein
MPKFGFDSLWTGKFGMPRGLGETLDKKMALNKMSCEFHIRRGLCYAIMLKYRP